MGLKIGLTGGIATGKTTVANLFSDLGITVIDADLIAREVVLPGTPGLHGIVDLFGQQVLDEDHRLDRKLLRKLIFSDPEKKTAIDNLLHPMIGKRLLERSDEAPGPYHLLDIPLLTEGGWHKRLDRVLVVDCTPEIQLERLLARDQDTVEQAQKIINSQAPRAGRLAIADDIIDNNKTLESLSRQVYSLHQHYLTLAYAAGNSGDTSTSQN